MLIEEDVVVSKGLIDPKSRRLVIGVSGASYSLIEGLSDHYAVPSDTTIHDRIFERNYTGKWDSETVLRLFKDVVDEIELSLTVNCGGVIFNYTPIDAISLLLLHLTKFERTDEMQAEADAIVNQALGLCPQFTHFIHVFPSGKERTISTDLLANLRAGVYNRYYERLGGVVFSVAEILSTDKDRLEWIKHVMEILV